jgi:uncharacterized protein with von Willebrand factor type A (vWA) domain
MADVRSPAEVLAVAFCRLLRAGGILTPIGNVILFVESLERLGMDSRDAVYWAGRSTLVRRPEDIDLYDRAFAVFWERRRSQTLDESTEPMRLTILLDDENASNDGSSESSMNDDDETITIRFSAVETLRTKDFAAYTSDELDEVASRRYTTALLPQTPESTRFSSRRSAHCEIQLAHRG